MTDAFYMDGLSEGIKSFIQRSGILEEECHSMKIATVRNLGLALATVAALAAPSRADQTIDFSAGAPISPTPGPGVWYVDRYAPAGFLAPVNTNQLQESINASDYQGAGSFYNTQGRKFDVETGTFAAQIQVYVDPNWTTATGNDVIRYAGFWGTGTDSTSAVASYPIIEVVSTQGGFDVRTYDSNTGSWDNLTSLTAGTWDTLGFTLSGNQIKYTLNGSVIGSFDANGTEQFANVMLQGYNANANYSILWRDLQTFNTTSAVPEPASIVSAAIGLGAAGFFAARRRRGKIAA